jgi:flagellar biosynthetic protein FliO
MTDTTALTAPAPAPAPGPSAAAATAIAVPTTVPTTPASAAPAAATPAAAQPEAAAPGASFSPAPTAPAATSASLAAPAPAPASTGAGGAELWSSLLVTLLALAFVLALAWLLLRLLKRATTLRGADGQVPWQVVQALPLGGRERLVIVRRGAREYVLGVTPASVSLIDQRAPGDAERPAPPA